MMHVPDELLSAMLDNEAGPDEDAAHVDACPECRARLDALRHVAAVVGAPMPTPAAHLREAAVAAALVETGGAAATIRRLVTRSHRDAATRSAGPARRMSTASAAAALLVALGVGGWVLGQVGTDSGSDGTTTALRGSESLQQTDSATAADADAFAVDGAAGTGAAGSIGVAAPYNAGELGDFNAMEPLAAAAQRDLNQPDDVKAQHSAVDETDNCPMPPSGYLWTASVTYNGVAAVAHVRVVTESEWILEVLARTDCELLASQAIAPTTPR